MTKEGTLDRLGGRGGTVFIRQAENKTVTP